MCCVRTQPMLDKSQERKNRKGDNMDNIINAKRLINALYRNIDTSNIKTLSMLLNYDEKQLLKDIQALSQVGIIEKNKQ